MRLLGDLKWNAALAVFALFTALFVWLPEPQAKSTNSTLAAIRGGTARPAPASDDREMKYFYRVQDGDTVASLAHLFAISEDDLRRANRIPEGGEPAVGKNLRIPTE